MFDSTEKLYEHVFRHGAKHKGVGADADWAFGRSGILDREMACWNVAEFRHEARQGSTPRVGQLALCRCEDLANLFKGFGDRFSSRSQPFAPPTSFRNLFQRQWYRGASADGPLAQILLDEYVEATDGVLLIYDVAVWSLVHTTDVVAPSARSHLLRKPLRLNRGLGRIRMKLPPFSEALTLDLRKLRFASPEIGSPSREERFRIFGRTRGVNGTVGFSEESVGGIALLGDNTEELNSLNKSFRRDPTGRTRGALDCRILIFGLLPKSSENNPNVKTIRFILEPNTGELHSVAYVRQTFSGLCQQTIGLRSAIGSTLTGVQL